MLQCCIWPHTFLRSAYIDTGVISNHVNTKQTYRIPFVSVLHHLSGRLRFVTTNSPLLLSPENKLDMVLLQLSVFKNDSMAPHTSHFPTQNLGSS
mgnify:CR=1 FL=1